MQDRMTKAKLSVVRGDKRRTQRVKPRGEVLNWPPREPTAHPMSRQTGDPHVISLLDGWARLLERQATSIKG
jgi:hypothetical protein